MKTYIYNGVQKNANEFRSICLLEFPGLQHSRKLTIWQNIQKLAANGNEKAINFCSKVKEVEA